MTISFVEPVPITLPEPGRADRARRAAATVAVFGRAFGPLLAKRALGREQGERASARALRESFEALGATYVKFGQLVGSSPGAFGERAAEEFRSCLDTGPPVPYGDVLAVLEADLGHPPSQLFADIEPTPLAAASIAVVHRATLPDGQRVAVKVLRPGIERVVATDLDIMQPLFRFLALRGIPIAGPLYRFVSSFREQIAEELDLRNEARSMDHFRTLLADEGVDNVVIPAVHWDLTATHVLTMELLDGVPIDDVAGGLELGVDPRQLTQTLLRTFFLTGLRHGLFHGDIHAGNLLLLRDGRLGVLDWGIVARLDADTRYVFRRFVEAVLGDDSAWTDIAQFFAKMSGRDPSDEQIDDGERRRIERLLTTPFGEVNLSGAFGGGPVGADGAPRRNVRQRLERMRRLRRLRRQAVKSGFVGSGFERADFMLFKQLLYFERYGKLYLSDMALFGDRAFLERVLSLIEEEEQR